MRVQNKVSIDRLPPKKSVELSFSSQGDAFMQALLNELNEDVGLEEGKEELLSQSEVTFKGEILRTYNDKYGDFALLTGLIQAQFVTLCSQTGDSMIDEIEAEVKAVIIDQEYEERYEHQEDTTLYVNEDEYDLYYFNSDGQFELSPIFSEYCFLNKDPYPQKEI